MHKPAVAFFQLSNVNGTELRDLFEREVANKFNLEVKPFSSNTASPTDFWNALVSYDFIIIDGSIEEDHIYAVATPLTYQDNLLIVSRTPLPINYFGVRPGGAPKYSEIKSNRSIIQWLIEQIREILSSPQWIPKKPTQGLQNATKFLSMGKGGFDTIRSRFRKEGQVFISYRSRYFSDVQRLAEQVRKQGKSVFFLPPGELVYENELLTKMQHWLLSTLIDERVKAAEEVWIYDTSDYLNSWWTQAELVTIVYNAYQRKPVPRLKIFNPGKFSESRSVSESVIDAPDNFLPKMNKAQWQRMERLYAQTDPFTMSPEAFFTFNQAKESFLGKIPFINKYINDEVWSQEFWLLPLLPCATCKGKSPSSHVDVDKFLKIEVPGLYGLSADNLVDESMTPQTLMQQGGEIHCPICGSLYRLTAAIPRYIWVSKTSVGNSEHLLKRPVWLVNKVN